MAVKNLVSGVLAQSITTSTTNILVNIAENVDASAIQSFFPTPPFYITIMPKSPAVGVANRLDSEILQVTAVGSDQSGNSSLTCARGQRDTTAKAFDVGSIVTVGVYADDAVFLGSEGSAVGNPAPWVESSDIKNGAITTDKIADGAVTSNKINWATFKPYWKTVATSTSSNVTLPAGYRLYRIRLVGNRTGADNWGIIGCSQATGTTWIYIQGMSNGTWTATERSVTAPSDKAVMDGSRGGARAGYQVWDIAISKPDKNGTAFLATWETGMTGSLTFNTGRSIFNVTDGTADINLFCELSSALWSVEAFVEN